MFNNVNAPEFSATQSQHFRTNSSLTASVRLHTYIWYEAALLLIMRHDEVVIISLKWCALRGHLLYGLDPGECSTAKTLLKKGTVSR